MNSTCNQINQFVWHDHLTTNIDDAAQFYSNVLNWNVREECDSVVGRYPKLGHPNSGVFCGILSMPKQALDMGASPYWSGYIAVEEVDEVAEMVIRLGGSIYAPPSDSPAGRSCVFASPGGSVLGVYSPNAISEEPPTSDFVDCELLANNPAQELEFYSALFGWKRFKSKDTSNILFGTDTPLGRIVVKPEELPRNFWLYYVGVDDLETTLKRVTDNGGSVLNVFKDRDDRAVSALCSDPAGGLLGCRKS